VKSTGRSGGHCNHAPLARGHGQVKSNQSEIGRPRAMRSEGQRRYCGEVELAPGVEERAHRPRNLQHRLRDQEQMCSTNKSAAGRAAAESHFTERDFLLVHGLLNAPPGCSRSVEQFKT
jgi:hypothetical protein